MKLLAPVALALCVVSAFVGCGRKPLTPAAPWTDIVGDSLCFLAATTDPSGLGLEYTFDWNDGQTFATRRYPSGETAYARHDFASTGWRQVRVQARNEDGKSSAWSAPLLFRRSKPPAMADDTISGAVRWAVNRWYHASVKVTDPDGDSVSARFNWNGSGGTWSALVPSGSVITDSCRWSEVGPVTVKVALKDRGGMVATPDQAKTVSISPMAVVWNTLESELMYEGTPTLGLIDGEPVLYCLSLEEALDCYTLDGRRRWSAPVPGTNGYAPSLSADGSRLYLTCFDDTGIVCLDSRTGRRLWSLAECEGAWCTPALGPGGAIYVVTTRGLSPAYLRRVRDFGDSARVEWSLFLGVAHPVDKGAVVGRDGTVYAVGYDDAQRCSFLVAVDSNGTVLWKDSTRIQIGGTPVIDSRDRIIVADLNGGVYCDNPDGSPAWHAATEGLCPTSTAIGINDEVIVTTYEYGSLKAFDAGGDEQWTSIRGLELEGWNTPCVTQDSTVLVFDATSGCLYEIGDDGEPRWEFSIYDSLYDARRRTLRLEGDYGSPVIGPNGDIYVTLVDGLVCIAHGGLKLANTAWPTYNHDNARSGWAGRQ